MTDIERSYANLLLALCKYHSGMKDLASELREMSEYPDASPERASALRVAAGYYHGQSKAILWLLNRRKGRMQALLGVAEPEEAVPLGFELDPDDETLANIEFVPPQYLGVKKNGRVHKGARVGFMAGVPED